MYRLKAYHMGFLLLHQASAHTSCTTLATDDLSNLCSLFGSPDPGSRWKIPVRWHDGGVSGGSGGEGQVKV